MNEMVLFLIIGINILILGLAVVIFLKISAEKSHDAATQFAVLQSSIERLNRDIKDEFTNNREEIGSSSKGLREEVFTSLSKFNESILNRMSENLASQISQLESFAKQLNALTSANEQKSDKLREEIGNSLRTFQESIQSRMLEMSNLQMKQLESFATSLHGNMQSNEQRLKGLQTEVSNSLTGFKDSVGTNLAEMSKLQVQQLESFSNQLQNMMQSTEQSLKTLQNDNGQKLEEMRKTLDAKLETTSNQLREGLNKSIKDFTDSVGKQMFDNYQRQALQDENLVKQLNTLTASNEQRMDKMSEVVNGQLKSIQEDNAKKLEEMRKTVDEKLHETLEKRLGESFKIVGDRLEQVHKGLGEMQTLASGVGDLKRVLTNVKSRGVWGEIQLGNLLEQILTMEQYAQNVATKPGSNDRVEFAIKLPGRDKEGTIVWLPIDAKFPQEDYQRLLDAQEQANLEASEEAGRALENRIKNEAKNIATKYISVPYTTEFGILFLPTEGLYAEVLRRPGLCDILIRDYKVIITGPTTLAALLNSLQLGFRTLAIERRSSEVWTLLGAVKTEFRQFGVLLDKTGKKLQEASNTIDDAARRSRAIERKLKNVQELPQNDAAKILDATTDIDIPF